ncbi:MAG: sugar ABC transporter permease [Thermomicrobiales bacterium]|nr:MAG: sugar ABC transporter permease [Thermomicrobiales bacterium]
MSSTSATPNLPVQQPKQRGALSRTLREHWQDYLFISPFFILFAIFFAYPIFWAFELSFQKWNGVGEPEWVGLDNYRFVLNDPVTHQMFYNTFRFLVLIVPLGIILPLVFGVLLNFAFLRLRGIFRTLIFVPTVSSLVGIGIVWKLLFGAANGWLNAILAHVGLGPYKWLKDPQLAQVPIVTLALWGSLGFTTLIVLGGLQSIDEEIYDAAKIDGASGFNQFRNITLPLLRPVIVFLLITTTIMVMTLFSQPYIVTKGGPSNQTLTPLLHIYNIGIGSQGAARVGDASALTFILSLIMITVVVMQFLITRRRESI